MAALVDELMELFTSLQDPEEGDEVIECMRLDLEALGPEETAAQAEQARKFLAGFLHGAEDTNLVLYLAMERAHILATEARDREVWTIRDANTP